MILHDYLWFAHVTGRVSLATADGSSNLSPLIQIRDGDRNSNHKDRLPAVSTDYMPFARDTERVLLATADGSKSILLPSNQLRAKYFAAEAQARHFRVKPKNMDVLYDDLDVVYDLDNNL